ncbi:osmoprotectant transport system substrate-binding protein [Collimonas sp. OK242]|jgi:osmoprotectant transport system substrate-binding protein|uniref:glycine betaine ABC transporter substrate-binding protein OsmF n=1 Tax=Collimonas sp. OK242 TaxID=1798195 RepID=UPI00089C9F1C|nr:ABC transporter substrate-binding protein [Collimonas sp. OK242]SDX26980.1 osmoprotectant transport system substrate-binding protein [Collimonas sp. OK242]
MSIYRRLLGAVLVTTLAAVLLSPCAQAAEPVRVGSKIDTEGALLGNLIQLVLEANGIKTVNRLQIGSTKVVRGALISGEVDVYPEYTGNGAFFFSDEKNPAWKNADHAYQLVKKLDFEKNKLVWLTPAPANNTWSIAVRQDIAQTNKLRTLTDLGRWINQGGRFKLAASAEFIERPDALPAFESSYGFKLKQDQLLTLAGGDTAATIKAAAEQTSGVNAAMVYGTDGAIAAMGLVALDDVKAVQPVYAPTAVIRNEVLAKYPNIPDLLKPVFISLDSPTLQRLNAGIAIEGRDARKIAGDYLRSKGFIK